MSTETLNIQPVSDTKVQKKNGFIIDDIMIKTASGGTINITGQWQFLELYEDLYSKNLSGKILVKDAQNWIRSGPIVGQEQITITFKTSGKQNAISKSFRVYKISKRSLIENGKVQVYVLEFVSNECFTNTKSKCNYSLTGMTIGDMISHVFYKHFPDSSLAYGNIQTKNEHTFILPNRTPFKCIDWLTKRAISASNPEDCSYIFYRDMDSFKLNTMVNLLSKPIAQQGVYDYKLINIRETPNTFRNVKESFNIPDTLVFTRNADKLKETQNGMYASSLYLYDILTGTYVAQTYNYFDHFEKTFPSETQNPILAQTEEEKTQEAVSTLVHYQPKSSGNIGNVTLEEINNSPFQKNNDRHEEWVLKRESLEQQFESSKIEITISGNSDRRVGDMVEFNLTSPEPMRPGGSESHLDQYVSGKYLVSALKHSLSRQDYKMTLELSRNYLPEKLPTKSEV